ncbi:MAG: hypothetical protein ACFFCW_45015 [Candidatus Hodarchaeota archaeon]
MGKGQALLLSNLWKVNDRAALKYVPRTYPGRITQFAPTKDYALLAGPELCWHKLAAGGLEIHRLPVYPAGMLVEPFVRILAKELTACIDAALEITVGDER